MEEKGNHWMQRALLGLCCCIIQVLTLPISDGTDAKAMWQDGGGMEYEGSERWEAWVWNQGHLLGAAMLLTSITLLLTCICCKKTAAGFKELGSVTSRSSGGMESSRGEEFTMFPPLGISGLSASTTQINFEPLPDIRPRCQGAVAREKQTITDKTLPASFPSAVANNISTQAEHWFAEPHKNFPRSQLQYVREIGRGWFGRVLEGRATGINHELHVAKAPPIRVAVKVLREDATPTEQMYFLHELCAYRDLTHPNILKVLAYCLETEPFLILLQLCTMGDLKALVRQDKTLKEAVLLRMVQNVAAGLAHMHQNAFIHTDLAARNCIVDEDLTVKIGDYGCNIDYYKDEYYCALDVALPLRWCAPETLKCTDTTIETKEVTFAANVWSFGIIVWEVMSRGQLPYPDMTDDDVIQHVVIEKAYVMEKQRDFILHADKMHNIMNLCWESESSRPDMASLHSLLSHLCDHLEPVDTDVRNFESRWNQLQPPPRDHSIVHLTNTSELRFDSDFSLSTSGGRNLGGAMSPSLQNLRGSVEDLDAKIAARFGSALPSWLGMEPGQPMDSLTQEITDAIQCLDEALADEKSEPSSSTQTSPEKGVPNFRVGSYVSHPPQSVVSSATVEHSSLKGALSEGEDECFSLRLEQGEFSEMVRIKSQSVQDFMKLTVVEDESSDSDNASQRNLFSFDLSKPLVSEKTFSSEGNLQEAVRDAAFLVEIERLQTEHKFSIISEASRESPSSIEYKNLDFAVGEREESFQVFPSVGQDSENDGEADNRKKPFLVEDTSPQQEESSCNALENKPEIKTVEKLQQRTLFRQTPASPDCVVSSRDVKSAALPDIVVHDASSKQSSVSSSQIPVQVTIEQSKQFNFVFKEDKDLGESSDFVVFSDNIITAAQSDLENEVMLSSTCKQKVNESNVNEGGDLCKTIDSTHFFEQAQERSKKRLTSTPCRTNICRNVRQDTSNISLCTSQQEYGKGAKDMSYKEEDACASVSEEEKVGIMQKLSFEEDSVCKKSEELVKDKMHERSDKEDVNFNPEEVVEGEEIVIGALEDFSLDLYKGLKSSTSDSRTTDSAKVSKATKGIEIKVSTIPEFDLEQWDKFLGNALNRNKYESTDVIFPEGGGAVMVATKATSTDSLGSSFECDKFIFANTPVKSRFSEPIDNISEDRTEEHERNLKLLEISNTFNHNTCEEIAVILDKVDASTLCNMSYERPDLNTDNFFKSDSSLPPDMESPDTDGDSESSKLPHEIVFRVLKPSDGEDEGSDCSEAKDCGTKMLKSKSASETSGKASPSDLPCSSVSPCKEDYTEVENDKVYRREIPKSQDSLSGTSSPTGTYFRALSVDSTFDAGISREIKSKEGEDTSKIDLERTFEVIKSGRNYPSEPEVQSSALILEVPGKPGIPLGAKSLSSEFDFGDGSDLPNCKRGSGYSEGSSGCPLPTLGVTKVKDTESEESDLSPVYPSRGKDEYWSSQESQDSAVENDDSENGDFFLLQQMEAWKHAADQTRELLQQAASGSAFTVPSKKVSMRIENTEEILEEGSTGSSPKSVYSSTDLLNLDDEGTYVSYNTTDDEEIVGYKPEDINALRAELSLKLGSAQGPAVQEDEDEAEITDALQDRDNVVINYRGIVATTLSPIKEESFIGEFESPTKAGRHCTNDSADFSHNSSTKFQEPEDEEIKNDLTFDISEAINEALFDMDETTSIEGKTISENVQTVVLGAEVKAGSIGVGKDASGKTLQEKIQNEVELSELEDKMDDSLIVEDLEEDSGPSSITVYGACMEGDDDVLVVDTQTFEAKLIDRGKPRSHLAFISQEKETKSMAEPPDAEVEDLIFGSDDVAPESIPSIGIKDLQYDEMQHREQFLSDKPSWATKRLETKEYEGDIESKPISVVGGKTEDHGKKTVVLEAEEEHKVEASPQGIRVPQYHPYFTSALSTISHPNASMEDKPRFEEIEHISLPYDVNYPMVGDDAQKSVENRSVETKAKHEKIGGEVENAKHHKHQAKNDGENEEAHDNIPVRLSFLGSLYSQDSVPEEERKDGPKSYKSSDDVAHSKTPEPGETQHLTSAQFLALSAYQSSDHEEIEEQLEGPINSDDDDSEGSEDEGNGADRKKPHTEDLRYTPDWESDSDSDGESSSTSGEFMWKPGEDCTNSKVMLDVIEEEDEVGDNSDASESGEEEFTPSTWNRNLTPSKSLLKSPESKSNERKSVHWKRQRHHRVYEYPPEPRSWQQSYSGENNRCTWGRSLDYTTFADWELGCDEFVADEGGDIDDLVFRNKPTRPAPPPPIYSLASVSFDDADGYYGDDGEFFIRSSGAPFTFTSSSFAAADFFAGISGGRDYGRSAVVESDYKKLYFTPVLHGDSKGNGENKKEYDDWDGDGKCEDKPLDYQIQYGDDYGNQYGDGAPVRKVEDCEETQSIDIPVSETQESYTPDSSPPEGLGQLRHTRNKLRLELPSYGSTSKGKTESGIQASLWQDPHLCNGNADTYQKSQKSKRLEVSEI